MDRQQCSTIESVYVDPAASFGLPAGWPPEAELILSALETGEYRARTDHARQLCRLPYRVRATLRLFSDPADSAAWILYTRDVSPRSLGFVTQSRLPLGHGGRIELPSPDGVSAHLECTLLRCRQAALGWYEGAVHFNRDQPGFSCDAEPRGDTAFKT